MSTGGHPTTLSQFRTKKKYKKLSSGGELPLVLHALIMKRSGESGEGTKKMGKSA